MLDEVQIFDGVNFLVRDTSQAASQSNTSFDCESSKHQATPYDDRTNDYKWMDIPVICKDERNI